MSSQFRRIGASRASAREMLSLEKLFSSQQSRQERGGVVGEEFTAFRHLDSRSEMNFVIVGRYAVNRVRHATVIQQRDPRIQSSRRVAATSGSHLVSVYLENAADRLYKFHSESVELETLSKILDYINVVGVPLFLKTASLVVSLHVLHLGVPSFGIFLGLEKKPQRRDALQLGHPVRRVLLQGSLDVEFLIRRGEYL